MKSFPFIFLFLFTSAFYSTNVLAQNSDSEERYNSSIRTLVQIVEDYESSNWGLLELRENSGRVTTTELGVYMNETGFASYQKKLFFSARVDVRSTQYYDYYKSFNVHIPIQEVSSIEEVDGNEFYIFTEENNIQVNQYFLRKDRVDGRVTEEESSQHSQDRFRVRVPSGLYSEVKDLLIYIADYNQNKEMLDMYEEWGDDWK